MRRTLGLLALAWLGAAQAQTEAPPPVEATHLSGPVWMLTGRGGNVAVTAGEDGVALVDDQYANMTPGILAAIGKISDRPVRFVINTHWHPDHTGGNGNLAGQGAIIVAQDNVRRRMSTEQFMAFSGDTVPASPEIALPTVTFSESATLHLNGEPVVARFVPRAHTDGDAIVYFTKSKVLHMGDAFWSGYYPRIDLDTGANVQGAIAAVHTGLDMCLEGTRVIAGHGPLSDCQGLADYLKMLETTTGRVKALMEQGKTLDEIIDLQPNADYDATFGKWYVTPAQYLAIIYGSLKPAGGP